MRRCADASEASVAHEFASVARKSAAGARLVLLVLPALSACSLGGGGGSEGVPATPLSESMTIDGVVDFSLLLNVQQQNVDFKDSFGTGNVVKSSALKWAMLNDDRDYYFAVEWTDDTQNSFDPNGALDDFDGILLLFDNDGDGVLEQDEDGKRMLMTNYGSLFGDIHSDTVGGSDADDVTGDGLGRMAYSVADQKYQAEFLIPRGPDPAGEDGVVDTTTRYNVNLFDHVQLLLGTPAGNEASLVGPPGNDVGHDASLWPHPTDTSVGSYDQPQMPTNLGGLVAFISDKDNPQGEIYTFDPATGVVNRVTNSALYKDGVSLSHDRTQVAFYGGSTYQSFNDWEIWRVDVTGANLTQLTNNTPIADGHPGWSPDDSEIVYASFRDAAHPFFASLVRMASADGQEHAVLTPPGANDNDPDWTPDGRVVFKTDRFNADPQVRIAVMDADGTNVVQVTSLAGTSDHDPVANDVTAIFERFTKGTDYSTDPTAGYVPWNIVEAELDGSSERTLYSDGWVNWLPVRDPSGEFITHLRGVGYTDARLMTKDGRDLGRLIPADTKVRYLDWK